jgi:hypothetical protein
MVRKDSVDNRRDAAPSGFSQTLSLLVVLNQ